MSESGDVMYGPTTTLTAQVLDAIAQVAAPELGRVMQAIPADLAAEFGRLAQTEPDPHPHPHPQPGPAAKAGLADLPPLVIESLLGALEQTAAALELPVPQLLAALPEAAPRSGSVSIVSLGSRGEAFRELSKLEAFAPGATAMVAYVLAELAEHPAIAPLLIGTGSDEAAIAASHGARHVALAVVVATIVLRPLWPAVTPGAIIGAALGVTAPILRAAPMPPTYAEALVAKRRAEYRLPLYDMVHATVTDHVFTLSESPLASPADFSENGLVAVIPGGIAVRSGRESGSVIVSLAVVEEPPKPTLSRWDDIVEVSWHAPAGGAAFVGHSNSNGGRRTDQTTPPWPGDYRARVSVSGRDEGAERYDCVVWRAPAAEPVVHKRSDRLGYTLRGEPLPPVADAPDEVYRWVETGWLELGATVTFITGKSSPHVLRAFGADMSEPTPFTDFFDREQGNLDPWVAVLDVSGGTIAVEINGWQASFAPVLRALSSPQDRAASVYWSVTGVHRLGLARDGDLLTTLELGMEDSDSPEAVELLADLDVRGRHRIAVGLLAATRFTGISMSTEDLDRIMADAVGYPILPLLPDL